LGFDDEEDGTGFGFQGVGFVGLKDCAAHASGKVDSGADVGFDCYSAMDNQERGGVGDGGGFDPAVLFEMKAADMGVALAVG
jgi:hypothetical protein